MPETSWRRRKQSTKRSTAPCPWRASKARGATRCAPRPPARAGGAVEDAGLKRTWSSPQFCKRSRKESRRPTTGTPSPSWPDPAQNRSQKVRSKIQAVLAQDSTIGRYRIRERVGGGGNGVVYRAHDDLLARDVAIKILSDPDPNEPSLSRVTLTREAQAASALNHPNIVTVYDVGETESGPYIVMELIDGRTIRSLIKEKPSTEDVLAIGTQVARALELAHGAGIVHRDIKPENVMVRRDGVVKVLDFGLAKPVSPEERPEALTAVTSTGTIAGTTAYMSPGQARGEPLEPPSDIFALGTTLYELLARRHPFQAGDTVATLARVLSDTPAPPSTLNPEIPAVLDQLVMRMLAKAPRQRPATAEGLEALALVSGGSRAVAPATAPQSQSRIVGRDATVTELSAAFREVESSSGGRVIAISGEAGIGKSTIVDAFLADVVR